MPKLSRHWRQLLFAFLMSGTTAFIVSGMITLLHRPPTLAIGITTWMHAFVLAWPIVFLVILLIAPQIARLTDYLIET